MSTLRYLLLFAPFLLVFASCDPDKLDDDGPAPIEFDRQEMLAGWADDVVIPGYTDFRDALDDLHVSWEAVSTSNDPTALAGIRTKFDATYAAWQKTAPLVIGKAEELRLREQTNTYPTDVAQIRENIAAVNGVNLALPSQTAAQGLPALDYLFYGPDADNLLADADAVTYVFMLISRMRQLTDESLTDFTANRDAYVMNDGNSATASIDRTVNDYIFYYEKFLRAGKVGIPAGVFSDDPLADRVESRYGKKSKELYDVALAETERFFRSRGLAEYLDALNVERDGERLSATILNQFARVRTTAATIEDDFGSVVENNNTQLLGLYDEMQRLTVLLKVDMLQALSINVDFVDADGD